MDKVTIAVGMLGLYDDGPQLRRQSGLVYMGKHLDELRRVHIAVGGLPRLIEDGYLGPVDLDYGTLCLLVQEARGLWREHWYVWLAPTGMAKYYPDAGDQARAPETIEQEEFTDADLPF